MRHTLAVLACAWFLWQYGSYVTCAEQVCVGTRSAPQEWEFVDAYDTKDVCTARLQQAEEQSKANIKQADLDRERRVWTGKMFVRYACLPAGLDPIQAGK